MILIIGSGKNSIYNAFYNHIKKSKYIVYEKNKTIGGVFSNDFTYPNLKIHTNYSLFLRPLLRHYYPKWLKKIKDSRLEQKQICKYLTEFVNFYKLNILLEHEVLNIEDKKTSVIVKYRNNNTVKYKKFKKVYIPIGYGNFIKPKNTISMGIESKHIYEIDRDYIKKLKGKKKIIIVGGGKAGIDMVKILYEHGFIDRIVWIIRTPRLFTLNSNTFFLFFKNLLFYQNYITTPYYDKKRLSLKKHYYHGNLIDEEIDILYKLRKEQIIYNSEIKQIKYKSILLENRQIIYCDYLFYCIGHKKENCFKFTRNVKQLQGQIHWRIYYDFLTSNMVEDLNFYNMIKINGKFYILYCLEFVILKIIPIIIIKNLIKYRGNFIKYGMNLIIRDYVLLNIFFFLKIRSNKFI